MYGVLTIVCFTHVSRVVTCVCSVIGLPPSSEWPAEAVVPWSAFRQVPKLPLELRVPGIDFFLKDLLEVFFPSVWLMLEYPRAVKEGFVCGSC